VVRIGLRALGYALVAVVAVVVVGTEFLFISFSMGYEPPDRANILWYAFPAVTGAGAIAFAVRRRLGVALALAAVSAGLWLFLEFLPGWNCPHGRAASPQPFSCG
jgi:hypothetical protein